MSLFRKFLSCIFNSETWSLTSLGEYKCCSENWTISQENDKCNHFTESEFSNFGMKSFFSEQIQGSRYYTLSILFGGYLKKKLQQPDSLFIPIFDARIGVGPKRLKRKERIYGVKSFSENPIHWMHHCLGLGFQRCVLFFLEESLKYVLRKLSANKLKVEKQKEKMWNMQWGHFPRSQST